MGKSTTRRRLREGSEAPLRQRILGAAFLAFMENGYAGTSTLDIATRAQVSKATLYALVGDKRQLLEACISERAKRLQLPADLPDARDRQSLERALVAVGTRLLREVSDPAVIAVFRLAIAEAARAPEVARLVDSIGVETSRGALRAIMTGARSSGLLAGQPADMAAQFAGLLWGNLMVRLLLGVTERPTFREIERRARNATAAFLRAHELC